MNKKILKFSVFLSALIVGSFFIAGQDYKAYAAEEVSAQVFCGFKEKLGELELVQADTKTEALQKIKNELAVRKELLTLIIDCAIDEAGVLKTKLGAVKISDKEVAGVHKKTLDEVDLAIKYYESQAIGIENLGIQGSKQLAKKILDWRATNYSELVGRVVNIITWDNAEDFYATAEQRFSDVEKNVSGIKKESEEVEKVLGEAKMSLDGAKVLLAAAKKGIVEYDSNAKTIESIKKALEEMALIYKNFFELGQVIKDETLKKIE